MDLNNRIQETIRDVHDFPKPGIVFKDITPIMTDPQLSKDMIVAIADQLRGQVDAVAGIESRGFLFGLPVALALGVPFILIRKKGKLPYKTISKEYELEYGSAVIEMHVDSVKKGMRVAIHDDLLATGGTAIAASELVQSAGGSVAAFSFIVELSFLNAREKLEAYSQNIYNLVRY